MEQTINEIASSARELPNVDLPEDIPLAPLLGNPEKLSCFSRTTTEGNEYFTNEEVLNILVCEGKANQNHIASWKCFIEEQGMTI
jgi:hypothetical protein